MLTPAVRRRLGGRSHGVPAHGLINHTTSTLLFSRLLPSPLCRAMHLSQYLPDLTTSRRTHNSISHARTDAVLPQNLHSSCARRRAAPGILHGANAHAPGDSLAQIVADTMGGKFPTRFNIQETARTPIGRTWQRYLR